MLWGQSHTHLRVLRGGAFNNDETNLRCAYRNRNNPDNRNRNNGFRLVVSTFFSSTGIVLRVKPSAPRYEKWRGLSLAARSSLRP